MRVSWTFLHDALNNASPALAKSDPRIAVSFTVAAKNDFISVLKELALLAGRQLNRLDASFREFEH